MKARYLFVGLVALSAVLVYSGARYQERRRVELTAQLEQALDNGQKSRAIHLLQMGANANAKRDDGTPLIFDALDIDDAAVLKSFIAAGANVNVTMRSPEEGATITLLSQVGEYAESLYPAQTEEMKMLLEAGANPNLGTQSVIEANAGRCGHCGACWSNPQQVALLVQHGAKLRKGDAANLLETALYDTVDASNADALLRQWIKLPIPSPERRAMLANAIKEIAEPNAEVDDGKTLALLKRELHKQASRPVVIQIAR